MLLSLASTIITVVQAVYKIQLCKNLKTVKPEQGKKVLLKIAILEAVRIILAIIAYNLNLQVHMLRTTFPVLIFVIAMYMKFARDAKGRAAELQQTRPRPRSWTGASLFSLTFYAMKFSEPYRNSNFVSYCSVGCSSIGSELRPTTSPVSAST